MPTFMNRKLKPQISERNAKRTRQGRGRPSRVEGAEGFGGTGEAGEEAVAVLMVRTMHDKLLVAQSRIRARYLVVSLTC
ncbi:hypothetical protein GCM10010508_15570 [Streptomyces naganishii JCM 4654]|uniref:Uncharacterized protein n=1 Tax=Streptomyces naganishii JCM 4654 TaxID=1306179 RepID=A0A918Y284_9ACTN|nr:hypothetical protein GCM10010508_15570 [Streptomyces naganishii JCM 4654]